VGRCTKSMRPLETKAKTASLEMIPNLSVSSFFVFQLMKTWGRGGSVTVYCSCVQFPLCTAHNSRMES
jgi:hypothetical protein